MDTLLVDTNIFSYIHKKDTRAKLYRKHLEGKRLALSFMTVAEVYRWAVERKWGPKKIADLRTKLKKYVVLSYDDAIAWKYAEVRSIAGHPIDLGDAWIAASALRYRIPLVTHNRKHYEHIPGLQVISES
jgi:tRNA(fMet)-specific endonuclease VapC